MMKTGAKERLKAGVQCVRTRASSALMWCEKSDPNLHMDVF